MESSFQTINFQGQTVSFREGNSPELNTKKNASPWYKRFSAAVAIRMFCAVAAGMGIRKIRTWGGGTSTKKL